MSILLIGAQTCYSLGCYDDFTLPSAKLYLQDVILDLTPMHVLIRQHALLMVSLGDPVHAE